MSPRVRSRIVEGDGDPRHGSSNGYGNLRCRCPECTRAWAEYYTERGYGRRYKAQKRAAARAAKTATSPVEQSDPG